MKKGMRRGLEESTLARLQGCEHNDGLNVAQLSAHGKNQSDSVLFVYSHSTQSFEDVQALNERPYTCIHHILGHLYNVMLKLENF